MTECVWQEPNYKKFLNFNKNTIFFLPFFVSIDFLKGADFLVEMGSLKHAKSGDFVFIDWKNFLRKLELTQKRTTGYLTVVPMEFITELLFLDH